MNRIESLKHIVKQAGDCLSPHECVECYFRQETDSINPLIYCGYWNKMRTIDTVINDHMSSLYRFAAAKKELTKIHYCENIDNNQELPSAHSA